MTPVEFLTARYDEHEQTAKSAMWTDEAGVWRVFHGTERYERQWVVEDALGAGVAIVQAEDSDNEGISQHIARHDPASVLAEVESKRAILAEHPVMSGYDDRVREILICGTCSATETDQAGHEWRIGTPYPCTTVRLLALPYAASHPDYDPAWSPS